MQIYNYIKKLIIDNDIKEHEKLPPIRKLADYIGVNNATIVKVYELLENEGYIYKVVGSGTFASNLKVKKNHKNGYREISHIFVKLKMSGIPRQLSKRAVNQNQCVKPTVVITRFVAILSLLRIPLPLA